MKEPKLYMLLLGSKAPQRNVEQHDYFFGIADSLKALVPQIIEFWPEAGKSIHVDGWREINTVDGYAIKVVPTGEAPVKSARRLFFVNLGGYLSNQLVEQHHIILGVHEDRISAVQEAKKTVFFKNNSIKGANSHIDEKYGIDVDDIYRIEDILTTDLKSKYQIDIQPGNNLTEDAIHLGYFKLDKLQ
ncbi:MAG: DUF1543 domain-containing protein [Bacteroidota bacterium]